MSNTRYQASLHAKPMTNADLRMNPSAMLWCPLILATMAAEGLTVQMFQPLRHHYQSSRMARCHFIDASSRFGCSARWPLATQLSASLLEHTISDFYPHEEQPGTIFYANGLVKEQGEASSLSQQHEDDQNNDENQLKIIGSSSVTSRQSSEAVAEGADLVAKNPCNRDRTPTNIRCRNEEGDFFPNLDQLVVDQDELKKLRREVQSLRSAYFDIAGRDPFQIEKLRDEIQGLEESDPQYVYRQAHIELARAFKRQNLNSITQWQQLINTIRQYLPQYQLEGLWKGM